MRPDVLGLVNSILRAERPNCRTCKGHPSVRITPVPRDDANYGLVLEARAKCHNAVERRQLDMAQYLLEDPDSWARAVIDWIRQPWFLRNWAEYRRPTVRELLERLSPR